MIWLTKDTGCPTKVCAILFSLPIDEICMDLQSWWHFPTVHTSSIMHRNFMIWTQSSQKYIIKFKMPQHGNNILLHPLLLLFVYLKLKSKNGQCVFHLVWFVVVCFGLVLASMQFSSIGKQKRSAQPFAGHPAALLTLKKCLYRYLVLP